MTDIPAPWTVSGIANAVKRKIEGDFGAVRVQGEVGKVTRHSSGHIYFDLKDDGAVLHGAWFGAAKKSESASLETGAEVIVRGRLTTYPARSEYQIIAAAVELAGVGALLKLVEERKKRLAAEGLFDAERKRPLPFLPKRIGVITSPTGAVIHDILHRLADRFMPHVLLWPVRVQGEGAAAEVRNAIAAFNSAPLHLRPDVLIVARGGGSVEDLMPFNDEALVRAVAASGIPVISAIGHETDWTLVDFAADVRAPTPTGAAEIAVPVAADLALAIGELERRLEMAPRRLLAQRRLLAEALWRGVVRPETLVQLSWQRLDERGGVLKHAMQRLVHSQTVRLARLNLRHPHERIRHDTQRLAERGAALRNALGRIVQARALRLARSTVRHPDAQVRQEQARLAAASRALAQSLRPHLDRQQQRVEAFGGMLNTLGYKQTLARGYAVATDESGQLVTSAANAPASFSLEFCDGQIKVQRTE